MTLSVFTIDDRRKLQHYLNLPIQEIKEGSQLWSALVYVETLDSTEGSAIATDIQARLEKLDCLESVVGSEGEFISAIQSSSSQATTIQITDQYSESYGTPSGSTGYTGQAASLESYKKYLIASIRRDLGMSQQVGGNRLNATWPGGRNEPTQTGLGYRKWRSNQ